MGVVPADDHADLVTRFPMVQWNKNTSKPFILEGPDEAFDDGDAAVLADGAESWLSFLAPAPSFEAEAPELAGLVADGAGLHRLVRAVMPTT
jgi:hypothetical protein